MKRSIRNLCCMLAMFAVTGCSGMKPVTRGPAAPQERVALSSELKRLYRDVATGSRNVEALDGYADIYLKTPKRDTKAYCTVQVQKSKNARLIVTAGILGWPVADMLIRPDSLFVHDMLNNRMLVGRNNGENLEKILGVQAGFGQMTETLFGIAGVPEPESAIESVRQGGGKVSFTIKSARGQKVLVVDPVTKVLEEMILLDPYGRKTVDFRFADFQLQQVGNAQVRVPKEIDMELFMPEESASSHRLKVVYDERVINPSNLTISFRKPARAKVVNLDQVQRMPWL